MPNHEIAVVAISGVSFGLVIGFLGGYAVRAYASYLRRRANHEAWTRDIDARVVAETRSIISAASRLRRLVTLGMQVCRSVVPTPGHLPGHRGLKRHHRAG
jgi:hypothetical protein